MQVFGISSVAACVHAPSSRSYGLRVHVQTHSLCSSLSSVCVSVMSGCDATRENGEGDAMNLDGHFTLHVRRYAYRTELFTSCVISFTTTYGMLGCM